MPAYQTESERARARAAFAQLLTKTKPAVESKMKSLFAGRRKVRAKNGREVREVVDVAEDLSMRGGKRFRAALLVSTYLGQKPRGSMDVALAGGVALEMLQSYLLIQDDWMDGDVERRGGPSAHVALASKLGKGPLPPDRAGAVGAVLASDFVWGLAIEALVDARVDPEIRARALKELIRIHEDVVAGQVLDTVAKDADVELLHDLKTGSYTVRGPLALGALLGGATNPTIKALAKFGEPLGVAFQLRDDLLGVFGTAEEAGRPQGSDLLAGKSSSVLRFALPKLRGPARKAVDGVWKRRNVSARAMKAAITAITDTGSRDAVEKRLASLCTRAELHASKLPLSQRARDELAGASLAIRVGPGGREAR
ncbi:MAG: polyprenyl synthetase family protein [Polyangiaceae bacterium]|nr:polyprenyl synthetase family protein [Polyangiaceae bacterium]